MDENSENENTEPDRIRFICPRCKILYEHSGACIRCGAAVVDQSQSAVEEEPPPLPVREVETGELLLSSEAVTEREAPETVPALEVTREIPTPEKPISLHRPLNRLPRSRTREAGSPKRKGKRLFRLSWEVASILILVGTAVYLCWSIYSHFVVNRPEASTMASKKAETPDPPHPSTAVESPSPDPQDKNKPTVESPTISKEGAIAPVPQTASPVPPSLPPSGVPEEENIKDLLKNIQQGNLRKDIDLFMSCYSSAFKGREGKRKETLENWEHFNYFKLSYDMKNCSVSGNAASARVEWRITYSPKGGDRSQESQTVLDVKFKREVDGWKIIEVKPIG